MKNVTTMKKMRQNAGMKSKVQHSYWMLALLTIGLMLNMTGKVDAQVTTNGGSGLAANYATLADAITALNSATINSPVVITLTGNETAPAGGYSITQLGGTVANTITIQGSGSTITAYTPQVVAQKFDAIFKIIGGDYITIQNFTMQENSGNTVATLASNTMTEFGVALFAATATNGAQNNTIQNNTITLSSATKYQNAIGIFSTCASSSTNGIQAASNIAGTNSNNKFYSNTISGVASGFYFIAPAQTATVFESGNDIGGSSGATGNNITFGVCNTAGDLGFTSYSGATAAGVYFRNVVGSSAKYNTINSVSTLTLPCGGIFSANGSSPTGITYTTNFSNNNITLTNVGTTAITGIEFGSGLSTGTIVCNNNTININQTTSGICTAPIYGIKANYATATNTCNGNTITFTQSFGFGYSTGALTMIDMSGAGTTLTANSNTITVNQTNTSAASDISSILIGIKAQPASSSATVNIGSSGNSNTITFKQSSTSSGTFSHAITYIDAASTISSLNISYNTLNTSGGSLKTTGTTYGLSFSGTISSSLTVNNNSLNIVRISTSGIFYGIYAAGSTALSSNYNINNNAVSLNSASSGSTTAGIYNNESATKTMNGNSITITGSGSTLNGFYLNNGTNNVGAAGLGNTISLSSSAVTPTIYGVNGNGTGTFNVKNNTISTMSASASSTNAPIISAIRMTGGTTDISNNSIYGVGTGAGSGSATINGMEITAGTNNIYKNKIYDLSTSCTGTSTLISDIKITGGSTNIYNNLIGQTNTFTGVNNADAVRAFNITSSTASTTHNVYYNTIYLNSSSTGVNFGTTAIYHTASGTATTSALNLRNNIVVNNSTAAGTGKTVAYRRSSTTLTNYASTSNNNIFYAGTPGVNNLIMYDGTNSYQTLATFKTAVSTRDANSFTENPTWLGTTGSDASFLHLNTSIETQAESGAVTIGSYTDDFDGDVRNASTPDIGADEGAYPVLDITPPTISYTTLGNSSSISGQILSSVTITDPAPGTGINTASGTKPRIYFKRLTDANTYVDNTNASNGWKYVETTSGSSPFSFTIDFSLIYNSPSDAVSAGDFIQYFVVAQDLAATPNVGINNGVFTVNPASAALTSAAFPITGTISQYEVLPSGGSYTIGTGGQPTYNYASLTCANGFFAAMNQVNTRISSNMTVSVSTDLTEDGTNALNQWTETGAGNYTLAIQPSGARTISGSVAGNLITFNGADRVSIDGLNIGGNSLTISNTSTSGVSTVKMYADATFNTITNCTILGSTTASSASEGGNIVIGTGTATGNDNITISNCKIASAGANLPSKGIYSSGTNTSSAICNSSISITNCEIYDFFLAGGCAGIYVATGNTDWSITNNKFYESASRAITGNMYGVYFSSSTYGNNLQITGNVIGFANNGGTGTFALTSSGSFKGIEFTLPTSTTIASNISSNIISDVSLVASAGSTGIFAGIYNNSNFSHVSNSINVNNNQIKNITVNTTTGNVHGIYAGSATTLNCNTNIVDNIVRNAAGPFYGIQYVGSTTFTFNANTIRNLSSTNASSTAAYYGVYSGGSASNENITGNNIYNLTTSSTGAQTLIGIVNGTGSGAKNIQNNNVYSLTAAAGSAIITGIKLASGSACEVSGNKVYTLSGGITLYGIQIAAGSTVNTFKNKIYDITSANVSPTLYGLYLSGGTTNNVYNNIIGDLKTTAANSAIPLAGIYINTSTANIYYNTVYLNATSSGALFGSTAVYANSTPTVNFRNNIFVNNSTPKGTGIASAYRRSTTTLTSYAATSNNNLFYAGTPGVNNLIFYDGTNSDQTLAAFKTRMSTRDQASISENPVWASTTGSDATYLHIDINSVTAIESGGVNIATFTDDFDGTARFGNAGYVGSGTAPDIGADEFNPPYCIEVSGVNTTGITATSAVLSWTENGTATNWDIELGATGFSPIGTPTAAVSENPYTYSGLTPNTSYSYYVRANCGGTNSIWVGPYTFSTLPTCVTPTGLGSSAVAGTTATISWTAASPVPSNGYQYEVRTSGAAGSGSTGLAVSGTTAGVSANITGLLGETTYYVYVRSDCGGADYSEWTNSHSFTTTISCFTPSSLASSAIAHSSATLTWVAPTPAPSSGYDIYYSTSSTAPTSGTTPTATVGAGILTYNMTGLSENTTYYAWVRSHCIGTDVSDWTSFINFTTLLTPRIFVNATSSTAYGEYTTVKSAFDAINAGTHKGVISITLGEADNAVITETAQAVLNKSGSGPASYTSISISPAHSNITIRSNLGTTATIQLYLAQNVTIDGRIGSSGSTNDLTIENTSTGSSKGAIDLFGASSNTIRYCTLKSSSTATSGGYGTVSMSYTSNSGPSNNLIEYCNITKSGSNLPNYGIASSNASSTYKSQNNTVRYCAVFDFQTAGIWLGYNSGTDYNNLWTIDHNTFYQSSTVTISASNFNNYAIQIGCHDAGGSTFYQSSGMHTVSNNSIGGNGAGGDWTVTSTTGTAGLVVGGIFFAAGTTAYSEISGNEISNFNITNYVNDNNSIGGFNGIYVYHSKAKIGSAAGNSVHDITLAHPSTKGGVISGVTLRNNASYDCEISNNQVYDITAVTKGAGATDCFQSFYGIYDWAESSVYDDVINKNSVWNIDVMLDNHCYGIYASGAITQNHVSKIKVGGTAGVKLTGIYFMGVTTANRPNLRVENNEVILGLDQNGASTAVDRIIYGIQVYGSGYSYYNSVLIQGVHTGANNTCCLILGSDEGYVASNNLFYNERSGGTGKHYCIMTTGNFAITSSNNAYILYSGSKAPSLIGNLNGTDMATLTDWATATGETNSKLETTTNKPVATLFPILAGSDKLKPAEDVWLKAGVTITPVIDKDDVSRPNPGPTTMGAYEVSATLPVELLNITARKSGSVNVVEWQTASETNNDYFEVQKSTDATDWVKIGKVKGAGNSNSISSYSYNDESSNEDATMYYRLRQVDYDGQYSYSPIVSVDNSVDNIQIDHLYPVPANDFVYITYHSTKNNQFPISFKIYNCFGVVVKQDLLADRVDGQIIKIKVDDVALGHYYLALDFGSETKILKLVVVR
jgi:hypothetical protein